VPIAVSLQSSNLKPTLQSTPPKAEEKKKLTQPIGAIWIRNRVRRFAIREILSEVFEVSTSDPRIQVAVSKIEDYKTTLAVKVNSLKEKYIAIQNRSKTVKTQPDFFLHVYQTHTGAAPVPAFQAGTSRGPAAKTTQGTGGGSSEPGDSKGGQESRVAGDSSAKDLRESTTLSVGRKS